MKKSSKILSGLLSLMLVLPTITLPVHAEDVSYADSIKPELPANMITADAKCGDWNALSAGSKNAARLAYNFNHTATTEGAYDSVSYKLTADPSAQAGTYYKFAPIGKKLDHMSGDFEKGKSYIVTAMVKDISAEGVEPLEFGVDVLDKIGNHKILENLPIKLTKTWQQYKKSFKIDEYYGGLTCIEIGVPTTNEVLAGQGFMLDDISVVEEITYDIAFEGGEVVFAGNSTTVDADALNQIGDKGWLPQKFTWVATNIARTELVSGITVTPNAEDSSVATISVDGTVKPGKYSIVATANGFTKGYDIQVKSFKDSTPEMPANMIIKGAGLENNEAWHPSNGWYDWSAWQYAGNDYGKVGQAIKITASGNASTIVQSYGIAPVQMRADFGNFEQNFEVGKNYIISVWTKDIKTSEDVPYTQFATLLRYANTSGTNSSILTETATLSSDWTQYSDTITIPEDFQSAGAIRIGSPEVQPALGQGFLIDEIYVAEEVAYEINLTADEKLFKGDTLNASVEILNQLGQKGKLSQDCDWYVTDLDRKTVLDDFNIEKTATGVSVTLKDSATSGKYALVAMAGDAVKGVEFDVLANLEDTNGTMPANMITADPGCGNSDAFNKEYNAIGWNFNAETKADGYNGNAYKFTANTTTPATAAYAFNPVGKALKHMSGDFETGKNYIISAWVKDVSAEGVDPLEFGVAVMDKNDSWINTWVGSKITLTNEWQQYAEIFTTPSSYKGIRALQFGVPTTHTNIAGQAFMLDELYVAEEVAYEIKVTADANVVRAGDTITVDAEILNQLGKSGKLEQNVSWIAMNADRTAVIDEITVTPSATDSTVSTVSFAEDIEDGDYVIIAYSEETGLIKGMPVKVGGEFEATNVNIDINAGKVYFDLVGIPEAGATVNVYIAQYLGDALDIVEIEPVTVDGKKFAEIGKEAPFTYKDGAEVKVFIWDEDQNALLETPTSKKKQ